MTELHARLSQPPFAGMAIADQLILPTPLVETPLFLTLADVYVVSCPTLVMRSLEGVVYRTLRRNNPADFGPRFGPVFEKYVGRCLDSAEVRYWDETRLKASLPGVGKCVDFLIHEPDCTVFIEAKGIEASTLGRVSHTGSLLLRAIKDSAVNAIEQVMGTQRRIDQLRIDSPLANRGMEKFAVIVTFDDLFLGSNCEFGEYLSPRLQAQLASPLPLPLEHVFFLTIDEFERLLIRVKQGSTTLGGALRHARAQDADRKTRKFSFQQHLDSLSTQKDRLPILENALDDLSQRCILRMPPGQRGGSPSESSRNGSISSDSNPSKEEE